jgi:pSer/pThr/pTyr-binding forkhead associated (FHA) protein
MNAELVMIGKKGRHKKISIKTGMTRVGRRPDCQVRIPLPSISRAHCQISNEGGQLTIQDLGSANGTYVNDHQITESQIKAGDRVKIGTVDFVIRVDGRPKKIASVDPSTENQRSGSSVSQLSGSHVALGDPLSDLDLTADAGLDDSFS